MSPVIEEHTRARLITDGPLTRPVPVDLRYDAEDDPGTVHLVFDGGADWALGRELLEDGMNAPVENGEVRLWPAGRAQLMLELHSTGGVEVFQIDNAALQRFLCRTRAETAPPAAAGR
ncbi:MULTISPECIES: SsgA family sporulation/cell division regulator [unclassified Streptomyces]|uniref:SsgA family sporulation/cell division regulator n=1 Tax=unclassified Streptomyces TaxID=2593676 RepID=UPI002E12C0E8